jgi:uncharacterized membrane protein YheB (UPF0754 family)
MRMPVTFIGFPMNQYLLFSIPLITGLIGWLTNWIAIRMLFRPRQPFRFAGISWQGLIPRRKEDLAFQTAEIIETEILQQHAIRNAILSVDIEPHLRGFVERMVEKKLKDKLSAIPFVGSFINDSTLQMVKGIAIESLQEEMPSLIEKLAGDLESKIQVRHMVQSRMSELDLGALEQIVRRVAKSEFSKIEQLGAILGFVIGLIQMGLLML